VNAQMFFDDAKSFGSDGKDTQNVIKGALSGRGESNLMSVFVNRCEGHEGELKYERKDWKENTKVGRLVTLLGNKNCIL
jgi:hypothetical protein